MNIIKDHFEGVLASCKLIGVTRLLEAINGCLGASKTVEKAFGELFPKIMSLVYYLAQKGQPLSRCETWSAGHSHSFGDVITSQTVSELLDQIGPN